MSKLSLLADPKARPAPLRHLVVLALLATVPGRVLSAQQAGQSVSGTVVDAETKELLGNATVAAVGTGASALTNDRGRFTVRVTGPQDTLVVRRVGYEQLRIPVDGRTDLAIALTRMPTMLADIVVTGYGVQKRADVTGAVASVDSFTLKDRMSTNLVQAIQGTVPGVTVRLTGAGAEPGVGVQIRGRNSISASTNPLIILDGIPYNGPLSEINPNDIASIEVLKDASATAIYGARSSNGVLLITSKQGPVGKARITYNGSYGVQDITNVPRLMNAREFADFKCVRLKETNPTKTCDELLTVTERANQAAGVSTNWVDVGTQQGQQLQNDVTVSGGTEETKYLLGAAYLSNRGIALNDEFNRATGRANVDQKIASWLRLGTANQVAYTTRSGLATDFEAAYYSNPLLQPYDSTGQLMTYPWPEDPNTSNALEPTLVVNDDTNLRLFSSNYALVTVPWVDGLTYRLNAGLDLSDRDGGTYYGRNTQLGIRDKGQGTMSATTRRDWTLENILKYSQTFGKHSVEVTGLYSAQSSNLENRQVRGTGYPNDVLDYRSAVPLVVTQSVAVTDYKIISQMGRLNYQFDERFLATLTARRDGYSGFGADSKWGTFPSVALAWNISNEKFFNLGFVDALKLRFSYGKNGNQAINPYQTLAQLDERSYLNGDQQAAGYYPSTLGNPALRWETTLSTNVGMDLSMWRGRVNLALDLYSAETEDLLLRRAISSVHGITSFTQNIGQTANKGFELALATVNLKGAFEWTSDLNVTVNRNEIVDLYGDATDDIANGWFIGKPIDVNYALKFGGIFQEGDDIAGSAQPTAKPGDVKVVDVNGDGKIDVNDRTFIGSLQPDYIAGFTNTFKYRGVSLMVFLNAVQGVTRLNPLLATDQVFTDVRRNMKRQVYWTAENPTNNYPRNSQFANPLSVGFYEDASFVRLQDLTLSYDLPPAATRWLGEGGSLRVYLHGRNLWTSTEWSGLDPELSGQRSTPLERSWNFGMSVRF